MRSRRSWIVLGICALALAGFVALRRALGIDFDPQSLQQAVAGLGIWGPLVYVGIVAFRAPLGLPSGVVLIVVGLGPTMKAAQRQAYNRIENIMIPNMYYRKDIGDRWFEDVDRLHTWGYLKD